MGEPFRVEKALIGSLYERRGGDSSTSPSTSRSAPSTSTSAAAAAKAPKLGISSSNIGFKLLKQAGWEEGQGLGASKQGAPEPVAAWHQAGRRGIGAAGNTGETKRRRDPKEEGEGKKQQQQQQKKSKAEKQAAKQLEKDKQRQQALKDRALDRRMRRLFSEEDAVVQHNPLVQGNSRLSASNPLLDDD